MNRECHRTSQYGGSAPATPGFNALGPEWMFKRAAVAAPAIPAAESALGIAVGMTIADHPPRRPVYRQQRHREIAARLRDRAEQLDFLRER